MKYSLEEMQYFEIIYEESLYNKDIVFDSKRYNPFDFLFWVYENEITGYISKLKDDFHARKENIAMLMDRQKKYNPYTH